MTIFKKCLLILFLTPTVVCLAQSPDSPSGGGPDKPVLGAPVVSPVARTARWQEEALLLAGKPLPPQSPFYKVSRTPSFRKHALRMQAFWKQVRRDSLDRISAWREQNIPRGLESRPVFYPLSGADYLNAYAFFPRAKTFLFIALETPGILPDVVRMSETQREAGLVAIRRAVASLGSVNYMQSKVLRQELSNPYMPGTLPVFLMLAGGMGHQVEDVKAIRLDASGKINECDFDPSAIKRGRDATVITPGVIRGLRILVRDLDQNETKTIIYLQIRLREEAVTSATPEGRFLLQINNCNTIFKSAVYLLHNDAYKPVRDFVLSRSDLVVQDDSGLPYASFLKDQWEEYLFGTYTRIPPLGGLPRPPQQPLLARRYREKSEPLTFPYGYGVLQGKGRSNLMLFVKRSSRAALQ